MEDRKKYWLKFYLILIAGVIALVATIPIIPIKFNIGSWNVDTYLKTPEINFNLLGQPIQTNMNLPLGYDFEGGTKVTLLANMDGIEESERLSSLETTRDLIEQRSNKLNVSLESLYTLVDDEYKIEAILQDEELYSGNFLLLARKGELQLKVLTDDLRETEDTSLYYQPDSYQDTDFTSDYLDKAVIQYNTQTGDPMIQLVFTVEGLEKFGELVRSNIGLPIAIMIDGSIVSAPVISEDYAEGDVSNPVISGGFSQEQAESLVTLINSDELPINVEFSGIEDAPALISKETIKRLELGLLIAFILILATAVVIYGKLGVILGVSTVFVGMVILALLKFGFPALVLWVYDGALGEELFRTVPMGLPGLFGALLIILCFIFANVYVLENIKRLIRRGTQYSLAISEGFKNYKVFIKTSAVSFLALSLVGRIFTGDIYEFSFFLFMGLMVVNLTWGVLKTLIILFYRPKEA